MRTSTAEANNYICPECGDALADDRAGRGFVRHKTNRDCQHQNGLKDHRGDNLIAGGAVPLVPTNPGVF